MVNIYLNGIELSSHVSDYFLKYVQNENKMIFFIPMTNGSKVIIIISSIMITIKMMIIIIIII